jgi:hypothetical protein
MSILRNLYYGLFHNKEIIIKKPTKLNGYRWLMDKNYGRAYFKGYYEPKLTTYI